VLRRQRERVAGAGQDPDLRVWARVVGLVAVAGYLVAFVLENSTHHPLHFVFLTRNVSTIWLILLSVLIGMVAGVLASQLAHRRAARRARRDSEG
jgi:uncharacterized integral membrane protein